MASYVASPSSIPHISIHDYNDHNESQSLPSSSNQTFPKPKSLTLDQPDDKLIPHSFIKPSLHESANSSKKAQRQNYLPCLPSPPNGNLSQLNKVIGEDLHDKSPPKFPSLTLGSPRDPREFSVSNHKHKDHHESHIHNHNHTHTHDHNHHHDKDADHQHEHIHTSVIEPRSKFTNSLLPAATRWPLLHAILLEKDSRRIFYFMSLNFGFMLIQAFYGYITDSLGLLSDSIHMFFDCLALGVGLFAAIASKWPPSHRFPFGFGKIESLSGFGNGVFLILISIEIVIEAIERLAEGRETKHLGELLIVGSLGLIVNLVGMACFGHHGHAGHDHGGKCSKNPHVHAPIVGIETSRLKNHYHEGHDNHDNHEKHEIKMTKPDDALLGHAHTESHTHVVHSHSHDDDDNMHGIFLHVLADTMGSAAVIISTLLIYFTGFSGWDPIASCLIAILIFLSSIPLIKKSAKKLLLTLPDEIEYNLRDTLAGVSDLRGVSNYYAPRFWVCDGSNFGEKERVLGVIHIAATRGSDLDEVRQRTQDFFRTRGIDTVVQVEGNDDLNCWCGRKNKLRTSTLK